MCVGCTPDTVAPPPRTEAPPLTAAPPPPPGLDLFAELSAATRAAFQIRHETVDNNKAQNGLRVSRALNVAAQNDV